MKNKFLIQVLIAGFCILVAAQQTIAADTLPRKIEVTGSAEMEVVPDEIYITFTLKEYLSKGKQKVSLESIKADFLKLCKAVGIADSNISVAGYAGSESWEYYWRKKHRKEPDFMNSVSYTVLLHSVGMIDKIVAGLQEDGVENFYISKTSHSRIEQLRKEVKIKALAASKAKAEYLAQSLGEQLGRVLLIQEIDDNAGWGYYGNRGMLSNTVSQMSMDAEGQASAAPEFQKIKLRYEMRVEFELK